MSVRRTLQGLMAAVLATAVVNLHTQQLDVKFACSQERVVDNQRGLYANSGEIHIDGQRINEFHWESSLFRRTHGFECSIAESDDLQSEVRTVAGQASWRVSLVNGREARTRRGYDADHGVNCAIRLERNDETLRILPTCPALCGSRSNFSELSVDLKTGVCRHEE